MESNSGVSPSNRLPFTNTVALALQSGFSSLKAAKTARRLSKVRAGASSKVKEISFRFGSISDKDTSETSHSIGGSMGMLGVVSDVNGAFSAGKELGNSMISELFSGEGCLSEMHPQRSRGPMSNVIAHVFQDFFCIRTVFVVFCFL